MAKEDWTTIAIKKKTVKRLNSRKAHPRQTHTEVINLMLDATDKRQVKFDANKQ